MNRPESPQPASVLRTAPTRSPRFVLGLGCERGIRPWALRDGIRRCLRTAGVDPEAATTLASLDRKRTEPAFRELAGIWSLSTRWFSPGELNGVADRVPNPSVVVEDCVGTPSVAEASALLAAGTGTLHLPKQTRRPFRRAFTLAVARIG